MNGQFASSVDLRLKDLLWKKQNTFFKNILPRIFLYGSEMWCEIKII